MKTLSILCILLFIFSCKDKESPLPLPMCTCDSYDIFEDYSSSQEGEIFFPITGYTIYKLIYTKGNITKGWGPDFVICSDSTFLNQLILKQIKDHSIVKFTCGVLRGQPNQPCNNTKTQIGDSPLPIIRVKTIDLK